MKERTREKVASAVECQPQPCECAPPHDVARVRAALLQLPEQARKMIVLVHGLEGKPMERRDAASRLGIERQLADIVYADAVERLKAALPPVFLNLN